MLHHCPRNQWTDGRADAKGHQQHPGHRYTQFRLKVVVGMGHTQWIQTELQEADRSPRQHDPQLTRCQPEGQRQVGDAQ
ncbi:hypothetical protein D3C80_2054080 [compost metagenome]